MGTECQPEPATRAPDASAGMQKETDGRRSEIHSRHEGGQSHIQTQVPAVLGSHGCALGGDRLSTRLSTPCFTATRISSSDKASP